MWQLPGQVNVFAVPIALVCSIETPDVLITLLSKCGKVESDVLWNIVAIVYTVLEHFGYRGEV